MEQEGSSTFICQEKPWPSRSPKPCTIIVCIAGVATKYKVSAKPKGYQTWAEPGQGQRCLTLLVLEGLGWGNVQDRHCPGWRSSPSASPAAPCSSGRWRSYQCHLQHPAEVPSSLLSSALMLEQMGSQFNCGDVGVSFSLRTSSKQKMSSSELLQTSLPFSRGFVLPSLPTSAAFIQPLSRPVFLILCRLSLLAPDCSISVYFTVQKHRPWLTIPLSAVAPSGIIGWVGSILKNKE